jgi:hypothetical protein
MADEKSVSEILDFPQVSRDLRAKLAEDVTNDSVKAFYLNLPHTPSTSQAQHVQSVYQAQ